MMQQQTLRKEYIFEGKGLHTGKVARIRIKPAPVDYGIRFVRTDIGEDAEVRALAENVSCTARSTTITEGDVTVGTIEHLLSALTGMGADNARIEIDNVEVPILDGSAKEIMEHIEKAGLKEQKAPRKVLKVTRPVSIEYEGKTVEIEPYDSFQITFELDYPHPVIGRQVFTYDYDEKTFHKEIGIARTFGFKREVEALWSMGLAKGGSLANAIVIDDKEGVLNPEGLRAPDEFVRHKILDAIGDMSLLGIPLLGAYVSYAGSHKLNHLLTKKIFEESQAYEIVQSSQPQKIYDYSLVYQNI